MEGRQKYEVVDVDSRMCEVGEENGSRKLITLEYGRDREIRIEEGWIYLTGHVGQQRCILASCICQYMPIQLT